MGPEVFGPLSLSDESKKWESYHKIYWICVKRQTNHALAHQVQVRRLEDQEIDCSDVISLPASNVISLLRMNVRGTFVSQRRYTTLNAMEEPLSTRARPHREQLQVQAVSLASCSSIRRHEFGKMTLLTLASMQPTTLPAIQTPSVPCSRHSSVPIMRSGLLKLSLSSLLPKPMPGSNVAKVNKLLSQLQELDVVERQKRKFFDAKIGSQIKGILNCKEQMDTWNTKRRHRYADVLIADKFRDSEIEVMNKVRERRRKQQIWHDFAARVNSGLGRSLKPSLLPVELAAEEMALCGYKARNKKSSAARSMSCEPILDQSLLVERLRKTVFQGALADLTEYSSLVKWAQIHRESQYPGLGFLFGSFNIPV